MSGFCRDCFADVALEAKRCAACGSPRLVHHPELDHLTIAHLDCDAFYASVEKRDDPSLRDKPVIIGGGKRGVVSTCCYIARMSGVHSAMPMFKALAACPEAVVIRPDMAKYAGVARDIKARMQRLTPLVESLSLDEAFLDLSGTKRLHGHSPAKTMSMLASEIEREVGITVSVGIAANKFLAKVASDLKKPRGMAVIGRSEARAFLRSRPVTLIFGVGKVFAKTLAADGIHLIADLQDRSEADLVRRYGVMGGHLARLARGEDVRLVDPSGPAKSISAETTFNDPLRETADLEAVLWRLRERVAERSKADGMGGYTITLKLKAADFRIETRRRTLEQPTQLADVVYRHGAELLRAREPKRLYRLIGIGLSGLIAAEACDPLDLLDPDAEKRANLERAMDRVRAKFGKSAIAKGRGLKRPD